MGAHCGQNNLFSDCLSFTHFDLLLDFFINAFNKHLLRISFTYIPLD